MGRIKTKYIIVAMVIPFLIIISSVLGDSAQQPQIANRETSTRLLEMARTLEPNDTLLVWIDINASIDRDGYFYLPADLDYPESFLCTCCRCLFVNFSIGLLDAID